MYKMYIEVKFHQGLHKFYCPRPKSSRPMTFKDFIQDMLD